MSRDLVMLPYADGSVEDWARAAALAAPGLRVRIAPDRATALQMLPQAVAAFGTLDPELLAHAPKLQWLQAPMAAPPASLHDTSAGRIKVATWPGGPIEAATASTAS